MAPALAQGLWLCEAGFPTAVPKQILYPRQPDGLGLRAHPLSGLRIGFSLLSVRFPNTRLCVRYLSISLPMKTPYLAGGRAWRLRALASCLCVTGFPNGFAVCILLSRARTALPRQSAQAPVKRPAHPRSSSSRAYVVARDGACAPPNCHAFALFSHPSYYKFYGYDPAHAGSVIACCFAS